MATCKHFSLIAVYLLKLSVGNHMIILHCSVVIPSQCPHFHAHVSNDIPHV